MTTTKDDISAIIEHMVQEKTLSLEAMTSIQLLKDRSSRADLEIERQRDVIKQRDATVSRLEGELETLKEPLTKLEQRERLVAEREKKIHELEVQAAVAQAESRTFRHALGVVFAPNAVRESIQRMTSSNGSNGLSNGSTYSNDSFSRTEGYQPPDSTSSLGNPTSERQNLG